MILVKKIISFFDTAFAKAKVIAENRDKNLLVFVSLVSPDLEKFIQEFAKSDPRISIEKTLFGYWINFQNIPLFKVSLRAFSERAEVVVDGETILRYDGTGNLEYTPDCKPSIAMKNAILATFQKALVEHFKKELKKL